MSSISTVILVRCKVEIRKMPVGKIRVFLCLGTGDPEKILGGKNPDDVPALGAVILGPIEDEHELTIASFRRHAREIFRACTLRWGVLECKCK